jgi:hypothetical protein
MSSKPFTDVGAVERLDVDGRPVGHPEGLHAHLGQRFRKSFLGELAELLLTLLENALVVLYLFLQLLGTLGHGRDATDLVILDLQSTCVLFIQVSKTHLILLS